MTILFFFAFLVKNTLAIIGYKGGNRDLSIHNTAANYKQNSSFFALSINTADKKEQKVRPNSCTPKYNMCF